MFLATSERKDGQAAPCGAHGASPSGLVQARGAGDRNGMFLYFIFFSLRRPLKLHKLMALQTLDLPMQTHASTDFSR